VAAIATASTGEGPRDHIRPPYSELQNYPEKSTDWVQGWRRPFPFEDGDLVPESENFKGGVGSTAKEHAHSSEETEYAFQHELTVVTWGNVSLG
jgi:hypothetical protein